MEAHENAEHHKWSTCRPTGQYVLRSDARPYKKRRVNDHVVDDRGTHFRILAHVRDFTRGPSCVQCCFLHRHPTPLNSAPDRDLPGSMYLDPKPVHPREGEPRISSSTRRKPIFVSWCTPEASLLSYPVPVAASRTGILHRSLPPLLTPAHLTIPCSDSSDPSGQLTLIAVRFYSYALFWEPMRSGVRCL